MTKNQGPSFDESLPKSAALVYFEPENQEAVPGGRVACDYEMRITPEMGCEMVFLSGFTLEAKDFGPAKPKGIAFYLGDELLTCQSLRDFGVKLPLAPGDTVTVAPPNADLRKRVDAAWREWQSEESRDRGYDFALCRRLREKYLKLKEELQCRQ
jgi:hypothetical protein